MSERRVYQYCKVQKKVVPIEEVMVEVPKKAISFYKQDEMPPTKHPCDGKYYTSKARFRETTRAFGCEEVGDAYDKGYDPSRILAEREAQFKSQLSETMRAAYNGQLKGRT